MRSKWPTDSVHIPATVWRREVFHWLKKRHNQVDFSFYDHSFRGVCLFVLVWADRNASQHNPLTKRTLVFLQWRPDIYLYCLHQPLAPYYIIMYLLSSLFLFCLCACYSLSHNKITDAATHRLLQLVSINPSIEAVRWANIN